MNRRDFVGVAAGAMSGMSGWRLGSVASDLHFGCAAITWDTNHRAAIDDIAALRFRGIQLLSPQVAEWRSKPQALKELLAARNLTFVALSSGSVSLDPAARDATIALHTNNARFVRDTGGLYLQVTDQRPRGHTPTTAECREMGQLLTEIGRRTADAGIPLGYHNHMGALGQSPEEIARVLDAADPRYVRLELDIAHYFQAGGDPARAVREHQGRLLFLHIKDVAPTDAPAGYRFVELGRGKIDIGAVFASLEATSFKGWVVVELDSVPDAGSTPKEANAVSRRYLESLGLKPGS